MGMGLAIGGLLLAVGALLIKIGLMRKSVREIEEEFEERLGMDTNTLITISHQDKALSSLAESINRQLRILRSERRRFLQGDLELKEAVTNISHDLRTPLTAIFGYLELLERENKSDRAGLYLEQIENRAEVLKRLTEELFRFSVIHTSTELTMEKTDVKRVLEESLLSFYGAMCQRGMEPEISMPKGSVVRMLDPAAAGRIFGNIINNALKYSDGDLQVVLDETGTVIFSNRAEGLDPIAVGKLFDRFYTVETGRDSGGADRGNPTGIGLSIARVLTERMGGEIDAEYREGRLYIRVCFAHE